MLVSIKDTADQDVHLSPRRFAISSAKITALCLLLLTLALIGAGLYWRDLLSTDRTLSRVDLRFANVSRGDLRKEVAALGKVVLANSPTLYSSAEGVVTYEVKVGDAVKRGQILLVIASPSLANELLQEQASLGRLQSDLAKQKLSSRKSELEASQAAQRATMNLVTAQRTFDRYKTGFDKQFVSQTEFEKVEDELRAAELKAQQEPENIQLAKDVAKTDIQNAQLQLQRQQWVVDDLKRRVAELEIRSPVDGMVGSLALNQKDAVAVHQALITVLDLSRYEAEIDVQEHYAPDITPGMGVAIKLDGQDYSGEVIAIAAEIQGGQVKLRLGFTGKAPESLRQNQRISANILLEVHSQVLRLPRGSYLDSNHGQRLFRVQGNKAETTPVQLGALSTEQVEILQGLAEGDEVIVSDTSSYKDAKLLYLTN